ncbi:cytochrome c-type biogenesis protein [Rhodobacter capsulatus]|jgi:cytochrome c-type biogenesis protein CcmH|uniref:Cytochrome c-type biogenesis protein Ccl2 n=2 Tax=Rhodobacter capsulatus TaxID=1061 RepID=CCMH_RHOCB|nr:cytochrome c-type biogenesis protein [Rhodobacter capsulatus]Q00501.1 RecName: Full=Cytochrome c-type biogenesis protein Ccl2; Flags: Precursor [Rhodobacter capsulatus SB 1003]ADE86861.1 cytochrome c-type biogenesis protein CcmH [Rhodobacter capsulatus SB 1003]ETD00399.1 cytochrome C biogenesis protein CcdA [Rhodobacter capsulatus DE442]ETD74739.1 cytochrome C biogenesis protein CcdA [Rhodobacter capsulatus R121]ETD88856.1 cytochrome C biogenesis protein CcdA [Rhodobacter capsulatus YW2]ET
MLKRLLLLLVLATPVHAVQPDEVLSDPGLEARARQISQVLRCPVCQGENIDESNAGVSRDLRLAVRERLVAGDSDAQVIDYIKDRFGEYVLFEPERRGANLILYWIGPAVLVVALGGIFLWLRGRRREEEPVPVLSAEEEARLKDLLKD